ncbi:sulfate ABC transporter ATPase [Knoellia sinensis KCTC 19936]|uniref:Sulfate ABC transporter ATPase n=1 Tax=Knoellia sinensis KCTC 19936 TaxID=1385520 RepID=A0A0A0J6Q4_9MICO|nr:sulfate ABC transporter ATPase [Knoellia sinensis KCTC 19936]
MVSVEGLRKTYGSTVAVDDVSLDVFSGEIFGILGPNGAGKTTTVESIAGLRTPDAGTIRVHGLDPVRDREALTGIVGVQLQESKLQPKITVGEALELWSAFYPDPVPADELAGRLGLSGLLDKQFRTLSGGQQQRLSIALALVGRPKVVILDELTTGLDPRARREVWGLVRDVRDSGVTVLLVTHAMEEAQSLCDRVAIISGGRVLALDTPDGLIRGAAATTVTSFLPSAAVDLQALRDLDGVATVRTDAGRVVVEGAEESALAVLAALAAQGVTPARLRVVEGSLDTAYLDLTADELAADALAADALTLETA